MYILGLWDGHDSGVALLKDNKIVFAANEERFSRKKLDIEFPFLSIKAALKFASIAPRDVKCIALSTTDFAKCTSRLFPYFKRKYYIIRRRKCAPTARNLFSKKTKYLLTQIPPFRLTRLISNWSTKSKLRKLGFKNYQLVFTDHHLAHAAAAVTTSPFEKGVFLSLDGIGDALSGMIGTFEGNYLSILKKYKGKDSLGVFFEHVTNLLNMRELEDEGKVMALASFGYPVPDQDNPLLRLFDLDGFELKARFGPLKMYRKLQNILWQYPAEQFAFMAQRVLEIYITRLVEFACKHTGLFNVVYTGGVASNIKVNMLLKNSNIINNLYVFPHMGDGGLALGTAILAGLQNNQENRYFLKDLFLGPSYSTNEIKHALKKVDTICYRRYKSIEKKAAELIRAGKIILWFQGRMEYGPRALGNRSILALPNDVAIKNKLNIYLKKRVWYQPFCPTMLEEDAREMLEDFNGVINSFMTVGYRIKDKYASDLIAVTNADYSCRPQIIASKDISRYARLLNKVKKLNNHGVLLNTSLNHHGEPIVNTPQEALELLENSGFEYLVLEDYLVWKRKSI
jgi:carbamoyltransferase